MLSSNHDVPEHPLAASAKDFCATLAQQPIGDPDKRGVANASPPNRRFTSFRFGNAGNNTRCALKT
jgi:hypothetical protein